MNIKELQRGNYVSVRTSSIAMVRQVCEGYIDVISIESEFKNQKSGEYLSAESENHTTPLPITPDWLVKLKATPIDDYPTPVITKDKYRESYYVDIENGYNKFDLMWLDGIVYLKSRYQGEDLNFQALPHIKYVHQFQNLYNSLSGRYLTL